MAHIVAREFIRTGSPLSKEVGHLVNGRVRCIRASLALGTQSANSGDTIGIGRRPKGSRYGGHRITSSVSLATSTIAIGAVGSAAKYRAGAVFTAVDTPTEVAIAARLADDPLTDDEEMIVTVAVANLPTTAGAFVVFETYYTYD